MWEERGSRVSEAHLADYNFELYFRLEGRGLDIKSWLVIGFGVMGFGIRVVCESFGTCWMER